MANDYCNLIPTKKISEDFQNITIGFDRVQQDMRSNQTNISDHIANKTIHVTQQEKDNWNSKAPGSTQTDLEDHINDTVVHVTQAEHEKLDGIQEGAEVNQNAFSKINNVEAGTKTDSITIKGGTGITVTSNPLSKEVEITATGEAAPGPHGETHLEFGSDPIPLATETDGGLMGAADKIALNKAVSDISQIESDQDQLQTDLINHENDIVYRKEVHGLRIQDDVLEYYNSVTSAWVPVKGGGGVPVGNVSGLAAKSGNGQVTLTWSDPADLVVDGVIIAKWKGTKILRKTGSYPQNENDGILVVNNGVRDQYKTNGFVDTGLTNDITYYYMAFPYTENDAVTVNNANRVNATPKEPKIYGVRIDKSNSNPETSVTRTDKAVGMSVSDFDNVYPYNEIKPCILKNGVVQYYLNPNDFSKKADGSTADITSGNDGDVMIEFPKFFWKITSDNNYVDVKISDTQIDPSYKPLGHTKGSIVKDKVYIGAYLGFESTSKLRSLSGKVPTADKAIGYFRTLAEANGTGYQQIGFYQVLMLQILYLIKYKNLDSQSAIGRGAVDGQLSSDFINTGGSNAKGMYFGEGTGNQQMKFAGVEDFWGNLYCFVDGLYCDSDYNILIATQNFNDFGTGYTKYGRSPGQISGYLKDVQGTTETGFIAKEGGGSTTTYYCDSSGIVYGRVPDCGGGRNSGDVAGAFRLSIIRIPENGASNLGARLCYL